MPLILALLALAAASVGGRKLGRGVRSALNALRPNTDAMSDRDARAILGVGERAPREVVEAAYRRLMLRAHPDQGGTEGLAAQLNAARSALLG